MDGLVKITKSKLATIPKKTKAVTALLAAIILLGGGTAAEVLISKNNFTNVTGESRQTTGYVNGANTDHKQVADNKNVKDEQKDKEGVDTDTGNQPSNPTVSSRGQNSKSSPRGSSAIGSSTLPPTTSPSTSVTPKAEYNLNETWYFATAGAAGVFNKCWPTAINESNEAQCADMEGLHPVSGMWFEGIGVSKSPETAQTLAAAQAHQKAIAQHVDPRKGGGDNAVVLTEALCRQYGLSCGRW